MNAQMPSRYGELAICVKPDQIEPPITASSDRRSVIGDRGLVSLDPGPSIPDPSGNFTMIATAISMSAADTSRMFTAPSVGASAAVTADPTIEPSVPPTPMKPKRRFACSLRNASAIKHQKIDVLNSAKTVVHTKKARPIQMSTVEP